MLNLVQTNQTIAWLTKQYKAKPFGETVRNGKHESGKCNNSKKERKKSKNGIYFFPALFDERTNKQNL